jgi:hypothetical protein
MNKKHANPKNNQVTLQLKYYQGYEPIYNASYEFGFVFIDEDELDDDDTEFYDDDDDTLTLIH